MSDTAAPPTGGGTPPNPYEIPASYRSLLLNNLEPWARQAVLTGDTSGLTARQAASVNRILVVMGNFAYSADNINSAEFARAWAGNSQQLESLTFAANTERETVEPGFTAPPMQPTGTAPAGGPTTADYSGATGVSGVASGSNVPEAPSPASLRVTPQELNMLVQLAEIGALDTVDQEYWDSLSESDFAFISSRSWWPGGIEQGARGPLGERLGDYPFAESVQTLGTPERMGMLQDRLADYPFAESVSTQGVPSSYAGAAGVTGVPVDIGMSAEIATDGENTADVEATPVVADDVAGTPAMPDPSTMETTDWEKAAAELYPSYYAIIRNNPEIRDLIRRSIGPPAWSQERFNAELFNTNWYKTTSESARQWEILSNQDPAEAQARVSTQAAEIRSTANFYGVSLSQEQITQLATDAVKFGFNLQQINDAIGMKALEGGVEGISDLAQGYYGQEMRRRLSNYGVTLSDTTFNQYLNQIAVGAESLDSFQDYAMTLGKSLFPALADQFDAGRTFDQIVDPYKQTAARILEIAPDSVDFQQPQWQRALTQMDEGSSQQRLMSNREWGDYLRRDRSFGYEYTNDAKQKAYQTANQIADLFGRV
jgi:hypothetical protein